jgi:hypothetical protein
MNCATPIFEKNPFIYNSAWVLSWVFLFLLSCTCTVKNGEIKKECDVKLYNAERFPYLSTLEQFFIYKKKLAYSILVWGKFLICFYQCLKNIYIYVGILPLNCQQQTAQLPLPIFSFCFSHILFNEFIFIL